MNAKINNEGSIRLAKYMSKYAFTWEIPNFSTTTSTMKKGESICSEVFTTGGEEFSYRWMLAFYPVCYNEKFKDCSLIFFSNRNDCSVEVEFALAILNNRNRIVKQWQGKHRFDPTGCRTKLIFIEKRDIETESSSILADDKLRIMLEIRTHNEKSVQIPKFILQQPDCPKAYDALDHIEKLLDDQQFSDVKLIVGKQCLYAHKAILSRSPVFAAMFLHDMEESKTNQVKIKDVKYDVLKEMLRFIYCGKVERIGEIADRLLPVADKYALTDLKSMCENSLCDSLSLENVLQLFKIADCHNATVLKEEVKDFMFANAREVVKLPKFKSVKNLHEDLFLEIVQALVFKEKS